MASIFANKLRCLRCGSSMRSQKTNTGRYYTCHIHYVAPSKCEGTYISSSVLEKTVLNEIQKLYNSYIDDAEIENQLNFTDNSRIQIERISKQIESINKEIAKARDKNEKIIEKKR